MKFIVACVLALLAVAAWANSIKVEVVKVPDQKWSFHRVIAFESKQGITVSGRLNAGPATVLPAGHVDLAAYGPDGQLLAETTTDYSPSMLTPKTRKKGGVRFSAVLSESLPSGSVIKLAFHEDAAASASVVRPVHAATIAR
jgi:hypothetical protein